MVPDGPSPEESPGSSQWTRLRCPVTVANVSVLCALLCVVFPTVANYAFFVYRLVFGTLYPAYASYKAVRSRDVREYVKWMMYWIVFALFTCGETITDVFLSFWFPFYYEIKIGFVLWLLSPATKGSSILYRKFVHPMLTNREQEIDEYLARAKEQGYHTVLHLGSKGVNYATNVIMQTAIKSVEVAYKGGGGLVNQLRKSYSLSDLTDGDGEPVRDINRNGTDVDVLEYRGNRRPDRVDGARPSNRARGYSPRRSASGSARMEMYFAEVDLDVRQRRGSSRSREASVPLSLIRSSEDVSSGYTSGDHFYEDASQMDIDQASEDSAPLPVAEGPLVRTASVGSTRSTRTKGSTSSRATTTSSTSTAAKKATQGETDEDGSDSEEEDFWSDPMDHISPLPDRTIFANDLNTFPNNQPKLAVEFISSSAEVCQTSAGHVVNANLSSILIDNRTNLKDEELLKSIPVGVDAQLNEISGYKHSEGSDVDPITSDNDSLRNATSLEDSTSSSDTLTLCGENEISMSQPSSTLVSEEIVAGNPESKLSSEKEHPEHDIPSASLIIDSNPAINASEDSIADSSGVVVSSINVMETDSKATYEEPKVLKIETIETPKPAESTPAVSTPVEKTENEWEASKASSVDVTTVEQTEQPVVEDLSKLAASSAKETVSSRGGKYNKRPAPEPPQDDERLRGTSAEPDLKHEDAVHARLVLKRGIVRSLPDVGLASSGEVFLPVKGPKRPSPSPSRSNSPQIHDADGEFGSKNNKGNARGGSPRFLNLPGRHHFGSLTSLFPFWHGSTSAEGSSFFSSKKLGEPNVSSKKMSISKDREEKEGSEMQEKVGSEVKSRHRSKASSRSDGREGDKEKNFPIQKLSRSPSRSHSFRRFLN